MQTQLATPKEYGKSVFCCRRRLIVKNVSFLCFEAAVYKTKEENCFTHRIMQYYV